MAVIKAKADVVARFGFAPAAESRHAAKCAPCALRRTDVRLTVSEAPLSSAYHDSLRRSSDHGSNWTGGQLLQLRVVGNRQISTYRLSPE